MKPTQPEATYRDGARSESARSDSAASGLISFTGAGPGAADLITIRAARRLEEADIVIWASSLVPRDILDYVRHSASVLDSASMTFEDVIQVYNDNPGARIVRLHSGDPVIYGAIQEQIDWCVAHGRNFELVPGVSSLSAAAAAIGRELTIPGTSQSIILTRSASRTGASMPPNEDIARFSATGCTMGIFLSASRPVNLQRQLLALGSAYTASTPVAVIAHATWPEEQVIMSDLGHLAEAIRATRTKTTVLVLVGNFITARPLRSHLYSPDFSHKYRKKSLHGSTRGRPAGKSSSDDTL
ncbi:MAG: precorrin-4 C(11)-methyltransferase [Actinobacteria bacterium]|nr:precorrin-4 C(11)-methyltransferase [Actinomycetota bacterium]MCL5446184.1 precorrin-4 C(11)-methyltransferase [Actinomycetota bacterium]